MKIGMITDTFLPQIGGAEVHVNELSITLKRLGYDVQILTTTSINQPSEAYKVTRLPYLSGGGRKAILSLWRGLPSLGLFIKRQDVVHCHYTFFLTAIASPLAQLLRKPVAVTLHGLGTLDSSVKNSILMKLYRYLSFKFSNAIIATSFEMKELSQRFVSKDKIFYIPNGVDTQRFMPYKSDFYNRNKIIVLSMRRLHPKNGVQYLVESIPFIIQEVENIEFWIVGSKRLEKYLKNRVSNLNIKKYVKFFNEVNNEETLKFYQIADIVVFPSSAESTSISCLEAMSMEKAIVASALSAYKELLGDNERGILVKLFDREHSDYNAPFIIPKSRLKELARAIIELAYHEELRKIMGKNARKFVKENYDWSIIAKRVEDIYRGLVDKR